jgi:hypothetical protein
LLVPGLYVFRELEITPQTFLVRTLAAPLTAGTTLIISTWALRMLMPITYPGTAPWLRALPLILHLTAGTIGYIGGYLLVPTGRDDLKILAAKLQQR